MDVFEKIRAQQPEQRTAVWMVGEQLADIIQHDRAAQEKMLAGVYVKQAEDEMQEALW